MNDNTSCSGDCASCGSECFSVTDGGTDVTLQLDNGTTLECSVLTIFKAGGREYIALLPLDENGESDGEVYLYRYETVNGGPSLGNIESEEEYEIASDGFDEWLDTQEFDEMVSEEDLDEEPFLE